MNKDGWCETCKHSHGPLYICEHYSSELKEELRIKNEQYMTNLRDPKWIQTQLDNGIPPEGIAIFKALAGVR